jgi:hypothetical protein
MPKGTPYMSLISKRLVGMVASTALLSLFAQTVHAQTKFHNEFNGDNVSTGAFWISSYKFEKSMILNSIGFFTGTRSMAETSYSLGGSQIPLTPASTVDSDGFRWYEFTSGLSIDAGKTLIVVTNGDGSTDYKTVKEPFNFSAQEIKWLGARPSNGPATALYTNSNIRVSNPGSNVAPEPGSLALALTGGAALIGICVRRRRNAA